MSKRLVAGIVGSIFPVLLSARLIYVGIDDYDLHMWGMAALGFGIVFLVVRAWSTGGTRTAALWLAIVAFLAFAVSLPRMYSGSETRRARIFEGLNLAGGPKAAVSEYYLDSGTFPRSNTEAGLEVPASYLSRHVSGIEVLPGGKIVITLGGTVQDRKLTGHALVLQATDSGNDGHVTWRCSIDGVQRKHVPAMCR